MDVQYFDSVAEIASDRIIFAGTPAHVVDFVKLDIPEQEYGMFYVWLGSTATSTTLENYMNSQK